jgi:hypothetical protein
MAAQQEMHTGAGLEEPFDPIFIKFMEIRQRVVQERDPKERVSGRFQALPDLRLPHEKVRWSPSVPPAQVEFNCKTPTRVPPISRTSVRQGRSSRQPRAAPSRRSGKA